MVQIKVFYDICFPEDGCEDQCEVIMTDENDELATCDDLIPRT